MVKTKAPNGVLWLYDEWGRLSHRWCSAGGHYERLHLMAKNSRLAEGLADSCRKCRNLGNKKRVLAKIGDTLS